MTRPSHKSFPRSTPCTIWVTGLSAAGKTTLAGALKERLQGLGMSVEWLDGEELRRTFADRYGYSTEERNRLAGRIIDLVLEINRRGSIAIVSTITHIYATRLHARKKIGNFIEIYLRCPSEICAERDRKGHWKRALAGELDHFIGVTEPYQETPNPELVIDTGRLSPAQALEIATHRVVELMGSAVPPSVRATPPVDLASFWERFYAGRDRMEPSPFAQWTTLRIPAGCTVLDLGCGDGRDAVFFLKKGFRVIGVDNSRGPIEKLNAEGFPNASFIRSDFRQLDGLSGFDVVYSRFSLHCVSREAAHDVLSWCYQVLPEGGLLVAETRSTKDDLYGLGEPVGRHAFVLDHYRRFLDYGEFLDDLHQIGFAVNHAEEARGLAPFRGEDPVAIRVLCSKP